MFATDVAKNPGMKLSELERIIGDISAQPEWRPEAARACAYYDGNQIAPHVAAAMEDRGQPILINNLIGPTVDGVLGAEAKTRTGMMVKADDDKGQEVAEALNEALNEAARMAEFDRACGDAYAGQIKAGLDWLEVRKNPDPFGTKYQINHVHRREIFWDWHAKKNDLSDARWLARRQWMDQDQALVFFPKHKEIIKQCMNSWEGFTSADVVEMASPGLVGAYNDYTQFSLDDEQWVDSIRDRVMVYELYYRRWVSKPVMTTGAGDVMAYDSSNAYHAAAVATGKVEVSVGTFPVMRLAWFIGPHRIDDVPSPHPHNYFPYVPFWGLREDGTGVPYGLIRRMMSSQDEVNFRRSKLTWLLNAKRVVMDDDATTMSNKEIQDEVQRADGLVILNPNRKNRDSNAFRVETDFGIAAQQFQVMQDAQKQIQDTAGVYSSFLGKQDGGATSGIAINSLVEQGSITLSEINDNYRFARKQAGELLLAHIVSDLAKKPNHQVMVGAGKNEKTKQITLNQPGLRDDGIKQITNSVTQVKSHVLLADIQSSPGYRAQMSDRLMQLTGALPPELQASVLDLVIESTDMPKKDEILKRIRKSLGINQDPEEMTPEEQQEAQQQQQAAEAEQQMAQKQRDLVMAEMEAKIAKLQQEANRLNKQSLVLEQEVDTEDARTRQVEAQTQKLMVEMTNMTQEIQTMREAFKSNLDSQITSTQAQLPR